MAKITLLGESWEPRLPHSFVIREEILQVAVADQDRGMRALGAALGVTWGHKKVALEARYSRSGFDPRVYGGEVWDELRTAGCSIKDLVAQGQLAVQAISDSIPRQALVEERVGFSGPAGSSTDEAVGASQATAGS